MHACKLSFIGPRLRAWAAGAALILLAGFSSAFAGEKASPIAGSSSCRACHEDFYRLWSTSHHGLAMQPFTPTLAQSLSTTGIAEIRIGANHYRFDPAGAVVELGASGAEQRYPIAQAMGGKNVYYFLTPLERGRLQVLPLAFDARRREWFDMPESAVRHFGRPGDSALDWRERPLTFNAACHGCHVSQLSTNYDAASDSYHTTWAEPGINCETCHNSALEHVELFRGLPAGAPAPADHKILDTRKLTPAQSVETCAPCHAKMAPLSASFKPGERYFDHYDLVTLEDPDFYPDGRDLGENYTFTDWRLNRCAQAGKLTCVHCHTSSGRYRFASEKPEEANRACLPCHAARVANPAPHTHHGAASAASVCIACHMPQTEFARMKRSDHSLRPPAPAATLAFKSPNACNLCHADRDAAWADARVREWFKGDRQERLLARGRLIEAARRGDWSRLEDMTAFLAATSTSGTLAAQDEDFAAGLVRLLRPCPDPRATPALVAALRNPSPLVRAAAADSLGQHLNAESVPALVQALGDDYRLVRLRAAMTLAAVPREMIGEAEREKLARAEAELVESLSSRPDDAASRYNLGNYHLERGDLERALAQYEASLRLAPANVAALVNAALAWGQKGDLERAEARLREALKAEPASAAANFNLGLLLGERGDNAGAEAALRACLKADPANAAAAYNLAVIIAGRDASEAVALLRGAVARRPEEPKYAYTLAWQLAQQGDKSGAAEALEQAAARKPALADIYWLLGRIYQERGNAASAVRVYRQGAANEQLDPAERARFTQASQALQ